MRRLRWILLLLVLLVIGGVVAAALLVRPDLVDTRARVDATWAPLRAPLATRYEALGGVATALTDGGAGERAVTKELVAELARWQAFALRGPKHTDPGAEATSANKLEALARRARANVTASARLSANPAIPAAFTVFDQAVVPPQIVKAYNRAVRAYEHAREGILKAPVADALDYQPRPVLVLGT
ncbi:MAG: hypothetical protein MUP67_10185 [Acidimicrobiia bacterium]|nr:hypothetical protein [Acidimicrobiia bacterium]